MATPMNNTGNGVGSTDPRDLMDNAQVLDKLMLSTALSVPDRLGKDRLSWAGVESQTEAKIAEIDSIITSLDSAGVMTVPTIAAGLAATTNDQYFRKPEGPASDQAFSYYQNNSGAAMLIAATPGKAATDKVLSLFKTGTDDAIFQFMDTLGFRQFYALLNGEFGNKYAKVRADGITLGAGSSRLDVSGPEYLKVTDFLGQKKVIIDAQGRLVVPATAGMTLADRVRIQNNANLNYYSKVRGRYNAGIEHLVFALTQIIWYGQSLSSNQEGYPALSKTAYAELGNLMLGDSSRPNSRTAANFTPIGGLTLKPLKAVTQTADGSAVMTDAAVSALAAGSVNEGEGAVAAVNMLRKLFLRQMSMMSDPTRQLVLSSCGVNGRTVEQLSKGASPELYNRVREAVNQVKAQATSAGKTCGIGALCWLQGEWNYVSTYGGDTTREGYKAKVKQLYADFVADFCSGQQPPAMFTYQTSGSYTVDTNELAIGMAQLDMAKEGGNYYGVCPSYPFPDKGGHLTGNGYRWMDMFFAKVMFRVLVLGEGWEPLHCTSAEVTGNYALLNYAVPYPPLQWGTPYTGRTATTYADRGYRATDDSGTLTITAVEIVADTVVKLTFNRNAVGAVKIWYADKTSHNGNGCLQDSDPFVATENYVYSAGSGQYADENITALVDKPYPLNNWAWAQVITATVQ